jgi:glycosyltransferase involved in cell wall biosynthesis
VLRSIAILHYAAPPIVGGVESTIYHHARLLAQAGYEVRVIAGRGESFHPQVTFHLIPEMDSRHPEVLAVKSQLDAGQVTDDFHRLTEAIQQALRRALTGSDVCIVHNAITLHKNLPLTAALHRLITTQDRPFDRTQDRPFDRTQDRPFDRAQDRPFDRAQDRPFDQAQDRPRGWIAWHHDFAWLRPQYQNELHPGHPWDLLRQPWPGVVQVTVSQPQREELAGLYGLPQEAIYVVTPGVDPAAFFRLTPTARWLAETFDLWSRGPVLLLPARITRRKNIELAIRIVGALQTQGIPARLIVTGPPGPHNPANVAYLQSLRDLRRELGIEERVIFLYECHDQTGQPLEISDQVMADLYQMADALLFPSRQEGFGIPMLEAGLTRLPIFCADIPPFRVTGEGTACFFALDEDPMVIAQRMATVLKGDSALAMRRRVAGHYTWQSVLREKLEPLILSASSEERR